MLKINVISLFPNLFLEHLNNLPFSKAIKNGALEVNLLNLRDYAIDKHGTVDDKPYGGGTGMLLMIEPIYKALQNVRGKIVLLSPKGQKFDQQKAKDYSKLEEITFICGRYEGVDARVEEHLVDECMSIGDYVLSGGELPTMVIMECITRLLPGVLEKGDAAEVESFSDKYILEYPQYTRPENFMGMTVPDVLLSGNHKEIENWRKKSTT